MVNFAVCKPLDFIGFTGTPFFKTAPNFDFYFFGGYFLACATIIAQIAEQRFLLPREAAPVFSDAAPIPGSSGFDIHAALFSKPQDLLLFPFELRKIELRFIVHVDPVLDRQNCVEEVAVENGAVLRNLLRRLRGNQTFIPQSVHILFHRVFRFTDGVPDGGKTRITLIGFPVLAV